MSRILPFGAIIVALSLIFLYIRPTFSGAIADTKTHIESYDSALTAANTFTTKEATLTTQSAAIPGDSINRLNTFLPNGVDNIQLIIDLNGLAARSNMVLSNFSVGALPPSARGATSPSAAPAAATPAATSPTPGGSGLVQSGNTVDSLDVSLSAVGTYQTFRVFLSAIESSLRPLDITSLTVHQSNTGVYTYDMTVRIYWLHT
jgi:hypothetical protein